jgi:tetratricopeptide (TPR) repeat protein
LPSPIPTDLAIAIALAHHRAGRVAEAEGIYRQLLKNEPANARVMDLLGVLLLQTGRLELAEKFLRQAVATDPAHSNYHCNLGSCLRRVGKSDEALSAFRQAIRLKPSLAVAHNNLGIVLAEKLQLDEAIAAYESAVCLDPDYAEAFSNLANALKDAGRIAEALSACEKSIALKPDSAAAHNNLGVALAAAGRFAQAIDAYRNAIALRPNYGDAYSNLGNALAAEARHDEALAMSRRAVELEPQALQSHWNYAVILLRSGDLAGGFREYEWRWKQQAHFPRPSPRYYPPRFPTPHWAGGDIAGKTLLIHAEQGFGDTLHFCRYAPLVARRGGRVIMEVHPELRRLLASLEGVAEVFSRGETLSPFDEHCPVMSLPLAFGTTLNTIPAAVPYLRPAENDVVKWKEILGPGDGTWRVGLCWAGSPEHSDDGERSLALSQLAPLANGAVTFHSLQKGPAALGIASSVPPGMRLIDHTADLHDFADTAALIANLDLVITADTAVAHVAGALGKPVWVFLRHLSDWRWLIDRADTPWYPTMRLFRQKARGDWTTPINVVAAMLKEFTSA